MFSNLIQTASPNLAGQTLGQIISSIVSDYLFPAAGILLFLYLIYGGYEFLLSGGNPKSTASGKAKITNAIVGFVIMFAAYWIVQAVSYAFGLDSVLNVF